VACDSRMMRANHAVHDPIYIQYTVNVQRLANRTRKLDENSVAEVEFCMGARRAVAGSACHATCCVVVWVVVVFVGVVSIREGESVRPPDNQHLLREDYERTTLSAQKLVDLQLFQLMMHALWATEKCRQHILILMAVPQIQVTC
jgi:hypothetical protein